MDKLLCDQIDELSDQIDEALVESDFDLSSRLLAARLDKLKFLEQNIDKTNHLAFTKFSEYLLSVKERDSKQINQLMIVHSRLLAEVKKQNKVSQAVNAYSQVKSHK